MIQITAAMVKDLREKSGAGMMDAKNALTEAQGDADKAMELLRQKGILTAEKKSGRAAAEGLVAAQVEGRKGVLLEINCETDFVGRSEAFLEIVTQLSQQAFQSSATTIEALLQETSLAESDKTVESFVKERIGVIKENLNFRRYTQYNASEKGIVHAYIHTGGKIGVMIELEADSAEPEAMKVLAKDLTLHIASVAPEYIRRDEVPAAVVEDEKRIEMGKEDLQSKPVEIREKIVNGRIDKLLAQRVLLEQEFVKDPSKKVSELLQQAGNARVVRFTRFVLGEGIEKQASNFADEVMAQMKG
jgi:elongation factor Ts